MDKKVEKTIDNLCNDFKVTGPAAEFIKSNAEKYGLDFGSEEGIKNGILKLAPELMPHMGKIKKILPAVSGQIKKRTGYDAETLLQEFENVCNGKENAESNIGSVLSKYANL